MQPALPESVPALLVRLSANLVLLVANCVSLSSRDTYSTALAFVGKGLWPFRGRHFPPGSV